MPTTGPQQVDTSGMPDNAILATEKDKVYQQPQGQGLTTDKVIDFLRPILGNVGGLGAAALTGLATKNPYAAATADNIGYTGIDTVMQYIKGITGGKGPDSIGEAIYEGEKNAAINAVAGKLVHSLWSIGKGITTAGIPEIYKLTPTTSQALEAYGHNILATGSKFLENFAPASKAAALDRAGGNGFTQALSMARAMNKRLDGTNIDPIKLTDQLKATLEDALDSKINTITGSREYYINKAARDIANSSGQDTFKALDDTIANPDNLSKVLQVGKTVGIPNMDVKKDLQAYQFMKMVQDATTKDAKGATRIDPNMLAETWNDPKMNTSFNTLYGKELRGDISDFFKNIAFTQNQGPQNALLKYTGRSGFLIAASLLGKSLHVGIPTTAIGVLVGSNLIGKLLSSEGTGQLMVKLAEGAKLNETPTWASQLITRGLSGATVGLLDHAGNITKGHMEDDKLSGASKFVPDR